ncbi:MAG: hypothetical protein HY912_07535 [Desulfomonile tiedjei]|uniref:Uncharacterized protein n=1 Tax=Desulfomonile tiedjei TaxID=2358 RepID=A0A9D6Z5N4_9BACT|nr:hypothetical protein [Desulfomonile tiedjei]
MIFRTAAKKDFAALKKVFRPWTDSDPNISDFLEAAFSSDETRGFRCELVEVGKTIRAASLWCSDDADQIRLAALGSGPGASELQADERLMRELILQWSDAGVKKVTARIPQSLASTVIGSLKTCGFILEGVSSHCGLAEGPDVRMCKHFLHSSVSHTRVMEFLQEILLSLGYEVRPEGEGFGYRIKTDYRLPFIFSSWHRITRSGPDIIIHPPARILELHELETLFFPLTIRSKRDKPLLLPMEKKRAASLIDLPPTNSQQNTLFDSRTLNEHRTIHLNNLTYSYPTGIQSMRKGLPVLFYVNRIGAVGSGRIEEWFLDEPKNLYNRLDEMGYFDPEDVKEYAAVSGPRSGKVLVIRFNWYKPFKRHVALEEIRAIDESFNPQRTRSLSPESFRAITLAGDLVS